MTIRTLQRTAEDRSRDDLLAMLERRGIHDRSVLAGMGVVACPPEVDAFHIAAMLQALGLRGDERVLAIAAPSYFTAVVAKLVAEVRTTDDTANGLAALAPYDAIVMCAAGETLSHALVEQLVAGGRIVMSIDGDYPVAIEKTCTGDVRVVELTGRGACIAGEHGNLTRSDVP